MGLHEDREMMPYCITAVIENEAGMVITVDSTITSTISEYTYLLRLNKLILWLPLPQALKPLPFSVKQSQPLPAVQIK